MRTLLFPTLLLFLGCGTGSTGDDKGGSDGPPVDSDGDGISDADEAAAGTDPNNADSDGDGLADNIELETGSDPLDADSDGDGYTDGDEVTAGTDPTDSSSVIYVGGWPYNPNKDEMTDPGWSVDAADGEPFPRFAWTDQFGETVDIYDFFGHGKPVVIDLSGEWCYWCHELAQLNEGDTTSDLYPYWPDLPLMIETGSIYFVTVLDADVNGRGISVEELGWWYDLYPNPNIAVLADVDQEMAAYLSVSGYPTVIAVGEDGTVAKYRPNYTRVLDWVVENYPPISE